MARDALELQVRQLMDALAEQQRMIETLTKSNLELQKQLQLKQEQIEYLTKKLFGSSSEKRHVISEGQLGLFDEAEVEAAKETEPEPDAEEAPVDSNESSKSSKRRKPKMTKEELLKNLKVEEVIIELTEDERICNICGSVMQPAGLKYIRDELVYHPATLTVKRFYAQTYYCPECKKEAGKKDSDTGNNLVTAAVPGGLIPHSITSSSVVAHVMYEKYVNAVPLYRQEKDIAQLGVKITRGRLAKWIIICAAEYFTPIYDYIHRKLLQRKFLMADETTVQVLNEPDRPAQTKSFIWVIRSGEDGLQPLIYYGYTQTRARANALKFLDGFEGYLMTDGYQGYNNLPGVTRTCCWAHVRRKFKEAIPSGKDQDYSLPAVQGVVYCDKLFAIEEHCRSNGYTAEQRHDYRLKKAVPILSAFWEWLDKLSGYDKGSRLGKAVNYALGCKPYLETYLEDGRCSLSNNATENSIRPFCTGRRNWLFADSPEGAHASAKVYTMVEMAKANRLNMEDYLLFLLNARPHEHMTDEELEQLMPWSEQARANCIPVFME